MLLLQGSLLFAQQRVSPGCPGGSNGVTTYWYAHTLWQRLAPPDNVPSLIVITISREPDVKILLRAKGLNKFEIVRGTPSESFYEVLERAEKSCHLPVNPAEAVSLIPMTWKTSPISTSEFARLHREFIDAASNYVVDSQRRYDQVLQSGGVVVLHASEYLLQYDNGGYEHLEITVKGSSNSAESSLLRWSERVMALSKSNTEASRP